MLLCKPDFCLNDMPPLKELLLKKLGKNVKDVSVADAIQETQAEINRMEIEQIKLPVEKDQGVHRIFKSAAGLWDCQSATREIEFHEATQ